MPSKPADWLTAEVAKKIPARVWKQAITDSFKDNLPLDAAYLQGWLEATKYAPKEVQESWTR